MSDIQKLRTPPTIVAFGKRQIISTGQFNLDLVADKIIKEGVNDWLSVSDIAKFVYGKSFLANNKRVRAYIWRLRRELIRRGFLLLAAGRPVEHIKIFADGSEEERQLLGPLLKKMRVRSDFSAELYQQAIELIRTVKVEEVE